MTTKMFVSLFGLVFSLGVPPTITAQRQLISDFNDGAPDWNSVYSGVPTRAAESNDQLTIQAGFPATSDNLGNSMTFVEWRRDQPIRDGQALEYRIDLVRTSRDDVLAGMYHTSRSPSGSRGEGFYGLLKDRNQIFLAKVNLQAGTVALFFHEMTSITHENVILSLTFTGVGDSVRISSRVLDKNASEAILFERTVTDSPGIDPTVVKSWAPEPDPGAPYVNGMWHGLYLAQFTDGNQPEAEVVYDNFTYEYRSAAVLNIEKAVRLSWPAFSTQFAVDGAPSVEGPWTRISEPIIEQNGFNFVTVPAPESTILKVFRLQAVNP